MGLPVRWRLEQCWVEEKPRLARNNFRALGFDMVGFRVEGFRVWGLWV